MADLRSDMVDDTVNDSAAPTFAAGPRERHDQWRSRKTHSAADMMKVYKEIFFAGFPCRIPYVAGSSSSSTTALTTSGNGGVAGGPTLAQPFPKQFVRDFFQHYGTIEHFVYDEDRGMGSVTFASGEEAEQCYLAVHLSFLPPPEAVEARKSGSGSAGAHHDDDIEPEEMLLYLEFAQCCPFVSPLLLLKDELQSGEISRHLLRTFPLVERKYTSRTAEMVVVSWKNEDGSHEKKENNNGSEEEEEGGGAATSSSSSSKAIVPAQVLKQDGPHYPGGSVEPQALNTALWHLLKPETIHPAPGNVVTVLDLWWVYYNTCVVHKTEPAAARISDPTFAFAQRKSIVQEVRQFKRSGSGSGGSAHAAQLIQRLVHDDTYHSVCAFLCIKGKLKNDPTWASLMRDVYSPRVVREVAAFHARGTFAKDKELVEMQKMLNESVKDPEAEKTWLALPTLEAAANVIVNVGFLRDVRRGLVDKQTGKRIARVKGGKPNEEDLGVSGDGGDIGYPALSLRQTEESIYAEVIQTIEGFATTGTASGLLAVCEDPVEFSTLPGHIGYEELHTTRSGALWGILRALVVPVLFLFGIVALILYLNGTGSGGGSSGGNRGAAPSSTPGLYRFEDDPLVKQEMDAMQAAAKLAAKKVGGSFKVTLEADL